MKNRYADLQKPKQQKPQFRMTEQTEELDPRIYVRNEKGQELEGEIIFSFEANGDEYVAYMLENDEQLYVLKYDEENNLTMPMEDEWPLIEEIVEKYANGEDEEEGEEE